MEFRLVRWSLGLFLALMLMGCGGSDDALPREPIWGTVTFDGVPLKAGSISFNSEAPVQGKAVAITGGAVITDGRYSIDRSEGLAPGKYRVAILSVGGAAPSTEAPGPEPLPSTVKDPIPARYNTKTTLTAEVVSGASKPFDFDLKSQ